MRKLNIVEIENSYLNFFTPAVIIIVGYFLFNIIGWIILTSYYLFPEYHSQDLLYFWNTFAGILGQIVVGVIIWIIFIPRLKVQDAEYQKLRLESLVEVIMSLCLAVIIINLMIFSYIILNLGWENELLWPFSPNFISQGPIFFVIIVINVIVQPFYTEILYRRTVIPLLEDRGCPSIYAVIFASIGHGMTILVGPILFGSFPSYLLDVSIVLIFDFFAGLIYISTRNVLNSYLFAIMTIGYRAIVMLESFYETFQFIFNLVNIVIIFLGLGIIIYAILKTMNQKLTVKWIRIIKEPSESKIRKGILGFFCITIGLTALQAIFVKIGRILTANDPIFTNYPAYFLFIIWFYLIAFTIPFFLTVSTEYAES